MVTAPVEPEIVIVEKGLAANRVVVNTVVSKYCDPSAAVPAECDAKAGCLGHHQPCHDGWMGHRGGYLLSAIVMAMQKEVHGRGYIQTDETTVMVQRPGERKGRNHQVYLWQFGNPGGSVVFAFHLGRGGEAALSFFRV